MATFNEYYVSPSMNNKEVNKIDEDLFNHRPGRIVISNRSFDKVNSVIVDDSGIVLSNEMNTGGVKVSSKGVTIQGLVSFTASGTEIRKGRFTENPNSDKLFTYTETPVIESISKELISKLVGTEIGNNINAGKDGFIPILTDMSAGPLPHFHTISMKHVHRTEPAYLVRVPNMVGFIQGALPVLKKFFLITG